MWKPGLLVERGRPIRFIHPEPTEKRTNPFGVLRPRYILSVRRRFDAGAPYCREISITGAELRSDISQAISASTWQFTVTNRAQPLHRPRALTLPGFETVLLKL